MAGEKFPKPYQNDVKKDESVMVYIPTDTMGIGARKSGLPNMASDGPGRLEHVGSSTGNGSNSTNSKK